MRIAKAVIGSHFGDEGKGRTVDYLASLDPAHSLVIRSNGGAQATHTVEAAGRRHVFAQVGSGALAGVPTLLCREVVSNPMVLAKELERLRGVDPVLHADPAGPVTTPFDMLLNQALESRRAGSRHGSCGIGFNETLVRDLAGFPLRVGDLRREDRVKAILAAIRADYLPRRLLDLELELPAFFRDLLAGPGIEEAFLEAVRIYCSAVRVESEVDVIRRFPCAIFEASQGLLLDAEHPWFPHVTHSRTGLPNVVRLCAAAGIEALEAFYCSRWYMTRHGAGPFPSEVAGPPSAQVVDRTNLANPWQGRIRFGTLDLDLLRQSLASDLGRAGGLEVRPRLVLTCLDQLGGTALLQAGGEELWLEAEDFLVQVEARTGLPVALAGHGPEREALRDRRRLAAA